MTPPKFCACCTEERRGLTAMQDGKRIVWLCVDCAGGGVLAELKQHDLTDGQKIGVWDGNRRAPARSGR